MSAASPAPAAASPSRSAPAVDRGAGRAGTALTCTGCGRSVLLLVPGRADCLRCGRRMRAPRAA